MRLKFCISVFWFLLGVLPSKGQETFFEFIPGWQATSVFELDSDIYYTRGTISGDQPGDYHIVYNSIDLIGQQLSSIELDDDSLELIGSSYWNSAVMLNEGLYQCGTMRTQGSIARPWIASGSIQTNSFNLIQLEDTCCHGHLGGTLTATENSELLLTAYRLTNEFYNYTSLSRYTTDLDRLWTKSFYCEDDTLNGTLQPFAVQELADESILLTTLADYFVGGDIDDDYVQTILIRTDAQGNEIWRTRPGDTLNYWIDPGMPVQLDNGNIMAFWSDPYIRSQWVDQFNFNSMLHFGEFDLATGEMIWESDLSDVLLTSNEDPDRAHLYTLKQAQILNDGSVLLTGYDLREAMFIKMSQQGEVEWVQFHIHEDFLDHSTQYNIDTWLFEVIETSDGGLAGVGEFRADPGGDYPQGFQSAFIIKLDEYGCLEEDCQVGLEEAGSSASLGVLEVYPNPSSGDFTIVMPENTQSGVVEIHDVQGRLVLSKTIGQSGLVFRDVDAPEGLYIIRLMTDDGVYSGRVMVE